MRHRWDYGQGYNRHTARHRSCKSCWATGNRMTTGTAPWTGMLPSGLFYDSWDCTPPCPGTPWFRFVFGDKSAGWVLPNRYDLSLAPQKIITPAAMTYHGRYPMETSLREQDLPPLPEEAWKDAA